MLVAIEGIDGSGKTSLLANVTHPIKAYPDRKGVFGDLFNTILSNGTSLHPEALYVMFLMDMLKDRETLSRYQGDRGYLMLLDRYFFSTIAYQTAQGMEWDKAITIVREIRPVIPDMVIWLDVDVDEALRRLNGKKEIFEKEEFLRKVRDNYERMATQNLFCPWVRVDANRDKEVVLSEVEAILAKERREKDDLTEKRGEEDPFA